MSNYDINSNPDLVKHMLEQYKASEEQMKKIQTAYTGFQTGTTEFRV